MNNFKTKLALVTRHFIRIIVSEDDINGVTIAVFRTDAKFIATCTYSDTRGIEAILDTIIKDYKLDDRYKFDKESIK